MYRLNDGDIFKILPFVDKDGSEKSLEIYIFPGTLI